MKSIFFFQALLLFFGCLQATDLASDFFKISPLEPETQKLLDYQKEHPHHGSLFDLDIQVMRKEEKARQQETALDKKEGIATVKTFTLPASYDSVPVRLYWPDQQGPLPVFVFIHGGGWVFGYPEETDALCQELARETPCLVVSIDYRLAPEHPFPAPFLDCYQACRWVLEHIEEQGGDRHRVAIGGLSAGGNLAAAVALKMRDEGKSPFLTQILVYPPLNATTLDTLSYTLFSKGYFLTQEDMRFFWHAYLQGQEGSHPYISPLKALSLKELPKTYLVIADYDPLRDEGLAFGWRLQEEEVPLVIKKYPTIHGFMEFEELAIGHQATQELIVYLKGFFTIKK